jgi:hypothetical protein
MVQIAANSSYIGFLLPGSGRDFGFDNPLYGFDAGAWYSEPKSGQALDDLLQQVVAGVTGLPENLVRPRWQAEPPPIPPLDTDWCALGVTDSTPLNYPAMVYNSDFPPGQGSGQIWDWEEFDILCSFYGPNSDKYARRIRTGLFIEQNRICLNLLSLAFVNTSGRTRVPALIQMQNLQRYDITLNMRRLIQDTYPILYFLSGNVDVITE